MKKIGRITAVLMCVGLLSFTSGNTVLASVKTEDTAHTGYIQNKSSNDLHKLVYNDDEYFDTVESAGEYLREQFKERNENVSVNVVVDQLKKNKAASTVVNEAFKHTGIPDEGDYLLWNYKNWSARCEYFIKEDKAYIKIKYEVGYCTSREQEDVVDRYVEAILASLKMEKDTELQKLQKIYTYICDNITFSQEEGQIEDHTAYGALLNKKCVCQGYAVLLYRMLLEEGMDCRVISGRAGDENHGWNIVKTGEQYYYADPTWDAQLYSKFHQYGYFLKGIEDFDDVQIEGLYTNQKHTQTDAIYSDYEFLKLYPMAEKKYEIKEAPVFPADNDKEDSCEGCKNGWVREGKEYYWYEDNVKQGTEICSDENRNISGLEIYDENTMSWYFLEADRQGARAADKDVYLESGAGVWAQHKAYKDNGEIDETGSLGKWVRYDYSGRMVKGWNTVTQSDNTRASYYFDEVYGTMAKGFVTINGYEFYFNPVTGILEQVIGQVPENGWVTRNNKSYLYKNYIRQGTDTDNFHAGKEIFNKTDSRWYLLDVRDNGARTENQDVYLYSSGGKWSEYKVYGDNNELDLNLSYGKWVRYDKNGRMIKGWDKKVLADGSQELYYFDEKYGTMAKGMVTINNHQYYFNEITGVLEMIFA